MILAVADNPEVSTIISAAKKRSRILAIAGLLGIVIVFASLINLYLLASNRAQLAENRERVAKENARAISDQLERIRSAYARGDLTRVGVELGVAVTKAEELTQNPDAPVSAQAVDLTRGQALRIATERLAYQLPPKAGPFDQAVYIQFAGNLTRAQITALNQALKASGWAAQGASGERLASAEGLNEVRYSGNNEAAATALAAALNAAKITAAPVRARRVGVIRGDVLEAWISG